MNIVRWFFYFYIRICIIEGLIIEGLIIQHWKYIDSGKTMSEWIMEMSKIETFSISTFFGRILSMNQIGISNILLYFNSIENSEYWKNS